MKSTTICILGSTAGDGAGGTRTVATTRAAIEAVLAPLGSFKAVFEVCPQAQWMAAILRPLAVEVVVANPSRIPWLFRDGRKNDRLDARKLATLLRLDEVPSVHLPRAEVSAWRSLINHRRTLVKRRTMVKNQIRSLLRTFMHVCPHKSCWSRAGQVWLRSLTFDGVRTFAMQTLLAELDHQSRQVASVEAELDRIAAAHRPVALLRTIPGVGPRTSEAIVAFTDRIDRFRRRKQFTSYFGMVPTQDASGGRERFGHITKRGPSVVRWLVIEAAHIVIRRNPALRAFFDQVRRGRKDRSKKAIVATGRKLLTIAYAMLRDDAPFDPQRVRPAA